MTKNDRLLEDCEKLRVLLRHSEEESSATMRHHMKEDILHKLHNENETGVLDRIIAILQSK